MYTSTFFYCGTIQVLVDSFTPWPLYPHRKTCWYPMHKKLGRPQKWFGCFGEQTNHLTLLAFKPQYCGCTACNQLIYYVVWYEVNGSRQLQDEENCNLRCLTNFAWKILWEEATLEFLAQMVGNVKMRLFEQEFVNCTEIAQDKIK